MSNGQSKPDSEPTPKRSNCAKALFEAATENARRLKREHRRSYQRDPKQFRATVKMAESRVFRLKPGPKENPQIAIAAKARAEGAKWEDLYPKYIDHYDVMPSFTRALAEAGLQRKVNAYLQHHPTRKRNGRGPQPRPARSSYPVTPFPASPLFLDLRPSRMLYYPRG